MPLLPGLALSKCWSSSVPWAGAGAGAGAGAQDRYPSSTENNGLLLDLHNNRGALAYGVEEFNKGNPLYYPAPLEALVLNARDSAVFIYSWLKYRLAAVNLTAPKLYCLLRSPSERVSEPDAAHQWVMWPGYGNWP